MSECNVNNKCQNVKCVKVSNGNLIKRRTTSPPVLIGVIELSKWQRLIRWLIWRNLITWVIIKFYTDIDPIFWGTPSFMTWNLSTNTPPIRKFQRVPARWSNRRVPARLSNQRVPSRLLNRRVRFRLPNRRVASTPWRSSSSHHS